MPCIGLSVCFSDGDHQRKDQQPTVGSGVNTVLRQSAGQNLFVDCYPGPQRIDQHLAFPAIIQDDLYIGNLNRYLVEVPSWGIVVNVELRNTQDTIRFQTGQDVFISWRVLDTILVKE